MDDNGRAGKALPNEHHRIEIERINNRKGKSGNVRWITASGESGDALKPHSPGVIFDHTGLAFSGGGIRSAAFCLGAIQALEADGKLGAVDYLSTVSGGGYIGCSLTALMGATGAFPFTAKADAAGPNLASVNDLQDSAAVQHIRDYSNYLMPRGLGDLTVSIGVVLRGLVASASLVVGPMLLLASFATLLHPSRQSLESRDAFGIPIDGIPHGHFILATIITLILVAYLFAWGLARSRQEAAGGAPYEFTSKWPNVARFILCLLVAVAFIEAQPLAILSLFASQKSTGGLLGFLGGGVVSKIGTVAQFLAPVAGVIAFFAGRLSDIIKAKAADSTKRGKLAKLASQLLLVFAAILVPLLLWIGWLYLVYWGTAPDAAGKAALDAYLPGWFAEWAGRGAVPIVYFVLGATVFLVSLLMEPNANSLHRLYRDRLSDAFLFLTYRGQQVASAGGGTPPAYTRTRSAAPSSPENDDKPLDRLKLSDLNTDRAPYLIINTALNIQGSPYVNKRGRNADFFTFTRDYVGSHATGLVPTVAMEKAHPALDLGTAMAISGAAVSSNMGDHSVRMLAPTLALLNVRLGYWMPNPAMMKEVVQRYSRQALNPVDSWRSRIPWNLYLLAEMFSLLDETSSKVYLTDGGHIENLGAYELLKRRCRFIVIADAEADPSYTFSSFILLQRYARIDLGIRIDDLAWPTIRARSSEYSRDVVTANADGSEPEATPGPHSAVASIDYPNAPPGILLYVKSSITGDENDLIISYKNDNSDFPHETTGDQFFGEAQFEAYRALGFHAMMHTLSGEDRVPGLIKSEPDGSPLPGQSDADARAQRRAKINEIFGNRLATGNILNT